MTEKTGERAYVWVGAVLFVVSLALTAWSYAVPFGLSPPFAGWPAVGWNILLFSLFAGHHSLFAREPIKQALAKVVPDRLLRSTYVWVASVLLILVCLSWRRIGADLYRVPGWFGLACLLVQLAGVWLTIVSAATIDPLELAGVRPARTRDVVQSHGPYGLVRHPLYLGWVLMVFAPSHMTGDRLTFAIVSTLYLLIAIPWEERSLERGFGEAYRAYKARVRWRILPYVY